MVLWLLLSSLLTFSLGDVPSRDRILGDYFVEIEDAPYQVALLNLAYYFVCGGAIILPHLVITTKSCATKSSFVRAGSKWHSHGGSEHVVVDYVSHPFWGDLAGLFISPPFILDKTRQPIIVATQEPNPGDLVFSAGWGAWTPNIPLFSEALQGITTVVVSSEKCSKHKGILPSMFCTLAPNQTQWVKGEGYPVVSNGELVGVFRGVSPGRPRWYPALHINLAYYDISEWVANQTGWY